jgi:hypothetical protein
MAKKPSNDDIPECELVLAMALQNANARGYRSTRNAFFNGSMQDNYKKPGPNTTACCIRGALFLEPDSAAYDEKWYDGAIGNNADDGVVPGSWCDEEKWRLGAAFEVALRDG